MWVSMCRLPRGVAMLKYFSLKLQIVAATQALLVWWEINNYSLYVIVISKFIIKKYILLVVRSIDNIIDMLIFFLLRN